MISIIPPVGRLGVLLLQAVFVAFLALLAEWVWRADSALPILYGGTVSVANMAWLLWRLKREEKNSSRSGVGHDSEQSARRTVISLYMTAVERFVLVSALFVFGMVSLELEPVALITGFIAGQLALLIGSGYNESRDIKKLKNK